MRGKAHVLRRGNRVQVALNARGLSPKLPHAVHIHGKEAGELAFCPGANRRADLVDDGLIETVEGLADYGPVQVSFTTRGDTSADSVLALDRFPIARSNGHLRYKRSFSIPSAIANRLEEKHIVIHGADLDRDGKYGGRTTKLGAPLEAELPVACGDLKRIDTRRERRARGPCAVRITPDGAGSESPAWQRPRSYEHAGAAPRAGVSLSAQRRRRVRRTEQTRQDPFEHCPARRGSLGASRGHAFGLTPCARAG